MKLEDINNEAIKYSSSVEGIISETCTPLTQNSPIKSVLYYKKYIDGRYLLLGNKIKPMINYMSSFDVNSQYFQDEICKTLLKNYHVFLWPKQPLDNNISFWHDHGFFNVLSLLKPTKGAVEAFGFVLDESYEASEFFFSNLWLIGEFISYWDKKTKNITNVRDKKVLARYKKVLPLKPLKQGHFIQQKKFLKDIGCADYASFLKNKNFFFPSRNIIDTPCGPVKLSSQELRCLYHVSRGRTIKETANCLGIGPRTAESYLQNIKSKTGYRYKSQLIDAFWEIII